MTRREKLREMPFSGCRRPFRKPVSALALALALLLPLSASGQAIRMSWFALPPHVFPPESGTEAGARGNPTGPTIELFEAIAAEMGYDVEWVGPFPLSRLDSERETGELGLDGGFLTVKTDISVNFLYYPARPYFSAVACLGLRSDNPLSAISSIGDIEGYRIGFVRTQSPVYPPIIADNRGRLVLEELGGDDWTLRNIQKLLEGRIDAVFELNPYSIAWNAAIAGATGRIKILSLPTPPQDHYFVFNRISPRAKELVEAYDRAVARMKFDYRAMLEAEIAAAAAAGAGTAGGARRAP